MIARIIVAIGCAVAPALAHAQASPPPSRLTLDEAITMALQHNHGLQAARTAIAQSEADEITANHRPNPELSVGWQGLPLFRPHQGGYLDDTEVDVGVSYLFERGDKRARRLHAATETSALTRAQVADSERTLAFQVASQFIAAQLAGSTIELAEDNLTSFQHAVEIADDRQKSGAISENDYLKIKLQLLQFQTDVEQAQLARIQALSDLRQLVGYDAVPAELAIAGSFDYQPLDLKLADLNALAARHRGDLRAAVQAVAVARSQQAVADANSAQDVTLSGTYSRSGGLDTAGIGVSIPLAIFDRNQGEIRRTQVAVTQAKEQGAEVTGQVMTDVHDAYETLQRRRRVVEYYRSGYLELSRRSREISEYAYHRGVTSLFDFLDAERAYRATQLGYRQALADYLTAVEQVRQSVGTRALP
jgi:cobalt-zinc-cadmium efflux system outer membrane protein